MRDLLFLSGHSWANTGSSEQQYIRGMRSVVLGQQTKAYLHQKLKPLEQHTKNRIIHVKFKNEFQEIFPEGGSDFLIESCTRTPL